MISLLIGPNLIWQYYSRGLFIGTRPNITPTWRRVLLERADWINILTAK